MGPASSAAVAAVPLRWLPPSRAPQPRPGTAGTGRRGRGSSGPARRRRIAPARPRRRRGPGTAAGRTTRTARSRRPPGTRRRRPGTRPPPRAARGPRRSGRPARPVSRSARRAAATAGARRAGAVDLHREVGAERGQVRRHVAGGVAVSCRRGSRRGAGPSGSTAGSPVGGPRLASCPGRARVRRTGAAARRRVRWPALRAPSGGRRSRAGEALVPALLDRGEELAVETLRVEAAGGQAGDLAAARGRVWLLRAGAPRTRMPSAQLTASLEVPVSGGRSRSRVPSVSRTRSTFALIARDSAGFALVVQGERQQHPGQQRRQRQPARVDRSGRAGARGPVPG